MPDCDVCSDLEYPGGISKRSAAAYRRVYVTFDDLLESAVRGCASCGLVRDAVLTFVPGLEASGTILVTICLQEYALNESNGMVQYAPTPMPFLTVTDQLERKSLAQIDLFREAYAPPTWQSIPIAQHTSGSTNSEATFDRISRWLDHCRRHHRCESQDDHSTARVLPRRVVDVGSSLSDSVQVHVSDGDERAPYVCLSHCWGKAQIVRTLKSNIEAFKREVPWSQLSHTFRDAVQATRRLGIRFLWIDSLCIIQDSGEDWRAESSKMADYYGGAELTLAATKSSDGHGGLYAANKEHCLEGIGVSGVTYRVYARDHVRHFGYPAKAFKRFPHLKGTDPLKNFPLLTRGWVYQERLLSVRMVHFGEDEIVWECLASRKCECHSTRPDQDGHWSMENAALDLPKLALYRSRFDSDLSLLPNVWRFMVMRFTELALTYGTDKLPALQGCAATHLGSLLSLRPQAVDIKTWSSNWAYIAGVWKNSLFDDLIWRSDRILHRPEQWRAPSFSWASVDSPVIYPLHLATLATETQAGSRITCQLKEAYTKPVDHDLGKVSSAHLVVSGILVTGALRYSASSLLPEEELDSGAVSQESVATGDPYSISSEEVDFVFSADYDLSFHGTNRVPPGSVIYALRVSQRVEGNSDHSSDAKDFSLVLRLIDETKQKYKRIGLLDIMTQSVLEYAEKHLFRGKTEQSQITIV